ncbi:MAG: WbqC family protein [Candidatus Aminicenantes bacterium]|jgi:hypothetical protein
MRLSFNQPYFLPWGGVFARLIHTDRMILLDETLLSRGFSYVNRNRIKSPSGEVWITVPLKKKGRGFQKIKNLEIYEKERWLKKFLETLRHFYNKSLYFEEVFKEIRAAVETPDKSFLNMALALMDIIRKSFTIEQEFVLQSETGISGKGTSLLVSLAKEFGAREVILPYFSQKAVELDRFGEAGIRVKFLRYDPPQYPQFWGEFIKKLSALDLLLCCGKSGKSVIEKGSYLYG